MTNAIVSLFQALFAIVENHIDLTGDTSAYEVYDDNNNIIGYSGTFTHSSEGILVGIRVITPENTNDKVLAAADVAMTEIETGSIRNLHITAHASVSEDSSDKDSTFIIDDVSGDTFYNDACIVKTLMSIIEWTYEEGWGDDSFVPHFYPHGSRCSAEDVSDDDAESIASAIADAANAVE